MKAVHHTRYGTPAVLSIIEKEEPVAGDGELLVAVHATTVNRTDCAILSATPFIMRFFTGLVKPKRTTTGTDFAGIVAATGKDVTRFKTGDMVFGFDDMGLSSHAQYIAVKETKAIEMIPGGLTFPQAAASLEAAHYAYNFINRMDIKPGQRVLINGATGGIGAALVQFVKHYGCIVTATCRAQHFELVKSLGADECIDYTATDLSQHRRKYDFVLDAVGKSSFSKCKHLLTPTGIYISSELGPNGQNLLLSMLASFKKGKKVIFPAPKSIQKSMEFICRLVNEGKFIPLIDREYRLEDIRDAFSYVASGQKTGNVIILPHTVPA